MARLSHSDSGFSPCRSCQQQEEANMEPSHTVSSPWMAEFRSSKAFVTWVVAIAVFTDVFIYGMIIPILPDVLKIRVSIPEDELQKWMSILLAAFGGALFVGSPVFGYLADKSSSRQAPFMIGLLALAGSTVMFWFARTIEALVVARTFQGLSCAVVWTVGMALIVDTMGKDQVGAAMGIVSMAMTVGTVMGPFMGGVVLSKAGYHAVFGLAIALIFVDIVLRLMMIERNNANRWIDDLHPESESESEAGTETERLISPATATQLAPPYESIQGVHEHEHLSESHPRQSDPKSVAEGLTDAKSSMPGMLRMICSVTLLVVLQATLVEAMAWASFDSVLPLYVRSTFSMTPLGIGLCFIPLFIPSFLSTFIGSAVDKHGSRPVAISGFLLDVPTFFLLRLVSSNALRDRIILYVLLLFAGLAAALKTVSLMVEVTRAVEVKERLCPGIFGEKGGTAQAYGLFNAAWSGGQVVGPLVAGWLVDSWGWGVMVGVFGGVSAVTAVGLCVTATATATATVRVKERRK
ncbi:major facilitator superfamily domain-containing protein [Aspergillus fruticulosus]